MIISLKINASKVLLIFLLFILHCIFFLYLWETLPYFLKWAHILWIYSLLLEWWVWWSLRGSRLPASSPWRWWDRCALEACRCRVTQDGWLHRLFGAWWRLRWRRDILWRSGCLDWRRVWLNLVCGCIGHLQVSA